jgi:hypothetical protein
VSDWFASLDNYLQNRTGTLKCKPSSMLLGDVAVCNATVAPGWQHKPFPDSAQVILEQLKVVNTTVLSSLQCFQCRVSLIWTTGSPRLAFAVESLKQLF